MIQRSKSNSQIQEYCEEEKPAIQEVFNDKNVLEDKMNFEAYIDISKEKTNQTSNKSINKAKESLHKAKNSKFAPELNLKTVESDDVHSNINYYNSNFELNRNSKNGLNFLNLSKNKSKVVKQESKNLHSNSIEDKKNLKKKNQKKKRMTFKDRFIEVVEIESYKVLNANMCFSDLEFVENSSERKSFCKEFCSIL